MVLMGSFGGVAKPNWSGFKRCGERNWRQSVIIILRNFLQRGAGEWGDCWQGKGD